MWRFLELFSPTLVATIKWSWFQFIHHCFYRTRVRSLQLAMLVSDSLTDWLAFSKLDWCDLGVWRCQLKTCWCCYCCWCWWWGSCWQQFVADLEAEVWSKSLTFVQTLSILVNILKSKFRRDFEAEVWSVFCCWCLVEVIKSNLGQYSEARFG